MSLKNDIYLAIRGAGRHRDDWLDPEDMLEIAADIFKIDLIAKMIEIDESLDGPSWEKEPNENTNEP